MKRIVYVSEPMNGGVLTYLRELTNYLCNKAKIYILYGNRDDTPANLQQLFDRKIQLIKIPDFQRALNPVKDFKAYLEIHRLVRKINPNIIHLNSSKAGALGRLVIHHKNQKWFYTPHGYAFLMQNASRLKRFFYYLVEWLLAKLGTKTIACGRGEYKIARKLSRNSTYVNNGVDTSKLKKYWTRCSNTENAFFTIGRINYQKNPKLFNKIAKRFPNYQFIWFGDGPLKKELTSSNIKVTGWLPSSQLFRCIQPYKYFVLCSRWEGLPMSLLEVMYFRKLCFVTDVVGNHDIVCNNYNGYVFNDINKLGKNKLFMNNIHYSNLRENAYKTIVYMYNLQDMLIKYMGLYRI